MEKNYNELYPFGQHYKGKIDNIGACGAFIQGCIQDFFGLDLFFWGERTQKNLKRIKNVFMFGFVTFVRVGNKFWGEGFKRTNAPEYGHGCSTTKLLYAFEIDIICKWF